MFVTVLGQKEASPWAIKPIGLPKSRHEGRMGGKGTLASRPIICRDVESWKKAHNIVLHNSALMAPYINEHEHSLRFKNPEHSEGWIKKEHNRTLWGWLQDHLTSND